MALWFILVPAFVAAFAAAAIGLAMLTQLGASRNAQLAGGTAGSEGEGSRLLIRDDSLSTIAFWAKFLKRLDFIHILKKRTSEAQLDWSLGRMTAMMLLSGAIAYAFLQPFTWLPGFAYMGGILLGALVPYFYVLRRRQRRFARFEDEFPDALESMCRALRAGQPLSAAIELLAYESPPAVAREMRKAYEEWKLGMPWEQALDNLAARLPVPDVSLFVAAVKLHSKTGGKLGQILGSLAESMREANALTGEVRAVAAHGRLTATILTLIPPLIAFLMNMVNPGYLETLVRHPYGKDLIFLAVAGIILAHFVMRKLMDIRP
jgi:tight adherence protein B